MERVRGAPFAMLGAERSMTHRFFAPAALGLALALPAPALGASTQGSRLSSPESASGRLGNTVLLARGSGYYSPHGSSLVRVAQRRLALAAYPPGPIDGRYGPLTWRAVMAFQRSHGLHVDGVVGPQTSAALARSSVVLGPGAGDGPHGSELVGKLQRRLALAGYRPGPIDGRYGVLTEGAVRRFQTARGLPANGTAGPQTLARVDEPTRPVQRSPHKATRPVQGSPHTAARQVQRSSNQPRALGARPHRASRQIPRSPAPETVRRQGHDTSGSSTIWLVILGALAIALILTAFARRRSGNRLSPPSPAGSGANGPGPREQYAGLGQVNSPKAVNGLNGHDRLGNDPPGLVGAINGGKEREEPATEESAATRSASPPPAAPEPAVGRGLWPGEASRAFDLGVHLEEVGDLTGAQAAFRRADESGHAGAASHLGVLLEERGALAEAEDAYRRADQRGDAAGAFHLGVMLVDRGALAEAEKASRRADDRGHPAAASNLGVLLEERGASVEAEAAYRRADERGDAAGSFNLGVMLEERGALAQAEAAYRRADQRGEGEVAEIAHAALSDLVR